MTSLHRGLAVYPAGWSRSAVPSIDSEFGDLSTPATPDHRFRGQPLRNNSAKVSLQDHASSAHPCLHSDSTNYQKARPTTPPPEPLESSPGPSSPLGLANVRIRRPHHGLLLQSPARAGHAARMRQIFEHASHEQQIPQPSKPLLYPQLPNVSRKVSPPLAQPGHVRNRCQQTSPTRLPLSLCMPTASSRPGSRQAQVVCALSAQSSESWSDDSGYLIMGSRPSTLAPAFVPDDRISEWLTGVSTPDCEEHDAHVQDHDVPDKPEPCQYVSSELSSTASSRLARQPLESQSVEMMMQDVSFGKDHTYTRTNSVPFKSPPPLKELSTGHRSTKSPTRRPTLIHLYSNEPNNQLLSSINDKIQPRPSSPKICIERGPSRYHSSRNTPYGSRASPTKLQYTPSKENVAPRNPVHINHHAQSMPIPDAPCKVGAGTRFQHPRHASNNKQGGRTRHAE